MKKLIFCFFYCFVIAGCGHKQELFKKTGIFMDTYWQINVVGSDSKNIEKTINEVFERVKQIDSLFRLQDKNSEISKINLKASGAPVVLSKDSEEIIKLCLEYSRITGGIFDVTVGPIVKLWGFGYGREYIPTQKELQEKLKLVGYENIELISGTNDSKGKRVSIRFKKKNMEIDFGGVAKGYALDAAIEILKKNNIKNAFVDAGGQIKCIGVSLTGSPWKVGIQNPIEQDKMITVIGGKNKTFSTSAGSKRYFIKNGIKYHHIFDPKTGFPSNNCVSATVILDEEFNSREGTIADVLSKAVFIMGPEKGIEFVERIKGAEAIVIVKKNEGFKFLCSKGLKNVIFNN